MMLLALSDLTTIVLGIAIGTGIALCLIACGEFLIRRP